MGSKQQHVMAAATSLSEQFFIRKLHAEIPNHLRATLEEVLSLLVRWRVFLQSEGFIPVSSSQRTSFPSP